MIDASVNGSSSSGMRPRQLILEAERLREENESLRQENSELRREVTRLRLYNQLEVANLENHSLVRMPDSVPERLRKLYYILPQSFDRAEFFQLGKELGYHVKIAQHILSLYTSEHLLVRKGGERFEKADLCQYELPLM